MAKEEVNSKEKMNLVVSKANITQATAQNVENSSKARVMLGSNAGIMLPSRQSGSP